MSCSEGAIDNNCYTKQSFCALNKQLVSQNPEIVASIGNIFEFAEAKNWEKIKTVLKNINDYGARGTRNPSDNDIKKILEIEQEDFSYLQIYNNVIKALQTGMKNINIENGKKLNPEEFLKQEQMKRLQTYINNYKLNEDRCNNCNTQCNAACQISGQGGGGGGGSCGQGGGCELQESCGQSSSGQCGQTPTQISNRAADCAMGSGFYPSGGSK